MKIGIIGGGIAGLTAGRDLASAGSEVVVFEKSRGLGGRTATRRNGDTAFDHGAQYFTCCSKPFLDQVEDWCSRGVAARWNAAIGTLRLGEFAPSPKETIRYVGAPRMSALARDLASGLAIALDRRVVRIDGKPGEWKLLEENGCKHGDFDAVVVATPAPQAVSLLSPAPQLAERAERVAMLPCHATMVNFARPLGLAFGGAFVSESPLAWIALNASKPCRPVHESWVLHSTSDWSARHLEAPSDDVSRSLLAAFEQALGRTLPAASHLASHRWLFARSAEPLEAGFWWDSELQIGACGDWLRGDRIEGAFMSGMHLARAITGETAPQTES